MISRSIHTIFEPSGRPIPSEDEVLMEAREIINRRGWGLPMIEALRKIHDPYWREAIARCLMDIWNELVRDKDEQTYYYDMDGCMRWCWMDAEYDFKRVIRKSTDEQVVWETTEPQIPMTPLQKEETPLQLGVTGDGAIGTCTTTADKRQVINIYITQNQAPIITDSNVTIHSEQ